MRLLRIQFKGAVFKGIVKVLALAACLISLCAVSACASENLPNGKTPAKIAQASSCENPVILKHALKGDLKNSLSGSDIPEAERIARVHLMGYEGATPAPASGCPDQAITKYQLASTDKAPTSSLYAKHMTKAEINADPNVKCRPKFKQIYQPPLKLGGAGKVLNLPDGERCETASYVKQDKANIYQNLKQADYFDAEDDYFPKGFNCPSRLDLSFRVDANPHGFSSQKDYVKGRIIIKYQNSNYDLLAPTKANIGIWKIDVYDPINRRYISLSSVTTALSAKAYNAYPVMRLRDNEEIFFSVNLLSYLGDSFFAEQGTRQVKISGLITRQKTLAFVQLDENSGLLPLSTLSRKCDPILLSYTPNPN